MADLDSPMTKARLLALLRERRAAWDALLAAVPPARMAEPALAGGWSVKDVVAHLAYHERWYADRLSEQLRGQHYAPTEIDQMPFDERNQRIYERERHRPLADVLADSRRAFDDLLAGAQAHAEAFLVEPQQFDGMPEPMAVWQMLRGDVFDHYGAHMPAITAWLEGGRQQ